MPSLPSYYNAGTASVTNGQTAVTGQGTSWSQLLREGDLFGTHRGAGVRIASVNSDTSLTLAYPWNGGTQATAAYEVQFTPYSTNPTGTLEELVTLLKSGNVAALAGLSGAGGNKIPRLTGPGTMDFLDSRRIAALAGLAGGADQLIYASGEFTLAQSALTAFARTLLDDANGDAMLVTLGGGAVGREALKANNLSQFLGNSGIRTNFNGLASGAAANIDFGTTVFGGLVLWHDSLGDRGGLLTFRAGTSNLSMKNIVEVGNAGSYLTNTVLGGTTGATGQINFSVDSANKFYLENRAAQARSFYTYILRG